LLDNYSFSEQVTESGVVFDYKLKKGAASTTNALKLLRFLDFDTSITDRAEQLAAAKSNY
jgi:DNA mismatch repair ATPase MutS